MFSGQCSTCMGSVLSCSIRHCHLCSAWQRAACTPVHWTLTTSNVRSSQYEAFIVHKQRRRHVSLSAVTALEADNQAMPVQQCQIMDSGRARQPASDRPPPSSRDHCTQGQHPRDTALSSSLSNTWCSIACIGPAFATQQPFSVDLPLYGSCNWLTVGRLRLAWPAHQDEQTFLCVIGDLLGLSAAMFIKCFYVPAFLYQAALQNVTIAGLVCSKNRSLLLKQRFSHWVRGPGPAWQHTSVSVTVFIGGRCIHLHTSDHGEVIWEQLQTTRGTEAKCVTYSAEVWLADWLLNVYIPSKVMLQLHPPAVSCTGTPCIDARCCATNSCILSCS